MARHIYITYDAGTSEGARKAAQTRKSHGGGGSSTSNYKHSASIHEKLAAIHEEKAAGYRGRNLHGLALPHQTKSRLHRAAAKAITSKAGNARELSEKAHAFGKH